MVTSLAQMATFTITDRGLDAASAVSRVLWTPAQSKTTWTPSPAQSFLHSSPTFVFIGSKTVVAPNLVAKSRRLSAVSVTMIWLAPLLLRTCRMAKPIGPAPRIRAVSPGWKLLCCTAFQATAKGSTRACAVSCVSSKSRNRSAYRQPVGVCCQESWKPHIVAQLCT